MDDFVATVGMHVVNYAIRSGISKTSTYAIGQCSRLLKSVDDKKLYSELKELQKLLDSKIKIISPAIDLIEFKSGRGNVFLEAAVPLTKSLHRQIISLGHRIEATATLKEDSQSAWSRNDLQAPVLEQVIADIKKLLDRIDREIPLLQIAITASGETLSSTLPSNISPSRLLQASTLLTVGDTQYIQDPTRAVQIGPAFSLSLYMLFLGHATLNGANDDGKPVYGIGCNQRKPLWQEVIHKARVRLCRSAQKLQPDGHSSHSLVHASPTAGESVEYAYHLEIIEDLADGRVHDDTENSEPYDDIPKAGVREKIPISQLSKIFYTDTGRILNIGNTGEAENKPVLLLKRDTKATASSKTRLGLCSSLANWSRDETPEGPAHWDSADSVGKEDHNDGDSGDEQAEVDRQLGQESDVGGHQGQELRDSHSPLPSRLPKPFDPEWLAFVVYDGDVEEEDGSNATDDDSRDDRSDAKASTVRKPPSGQRASLDSRLAVQIRSLSLQPAVSPGRSGSNTNSHSRRQSLSSVDDSGALDFVARSPFQAITSSLSLIEMLIRLAGLQEFQQTSHLAIPDHVLTFFLEETSTTGLSGEARRNIRDEAKRRVGFDPYTE